ncbi:nuclear transport factor 2 family protein [Myceligenerans salitolerans]|uniref:Nuclear transport factor 2 family protein n=1 Tax=Myceligenerans salitolerans TaxID=1230528 RepID=A0ABS3IBE0_9MICO|nr:nuclear transport factor 2 family protein [Myceligenerans salitolerans]MBO0610284.1 nuclear transport factor 2 family protein [Myceligenerans salitolerans]
MTSMSLDALVALEHQGWDALCASRGGTFYGDLMTADAVMVLPNGVVMDRDAIAAGLDGAPAWTAYTLTDTRLVEAGDDAAALVYRASAERDDLEEPFVALMSSVYRLVDGVPRLALYQQTTITH